MAAHHRDFGAIPMALGTGATIVKARLAEAKNAPPRPPLSDIRWRWVNAGASVVTVPALPRGLASV